MPLEAASHAYGQQHGVARMPLQERLSHTSKSEEAEWARSSDDFSREVHDWLGAVGKPAGRILQDVYRPDAQAQSVARMIASAQSGHNNAGTERTVVAALSASADGYSHDSLGAVNMQHERSRRASSHAAPPGGFGTRVRSQPLRLGDAHPDWAAPPAEARCSQRPSVTFARLRDSSIAMATAGEFMLDHGVDGSVRDPYADAGLHALGESGLTPPLGMNEFTALDTNEFTGWPAPLARGSENTDGQSGHSSDPCGWAGAPAGNEARPGIVGAQPHDFRWDKPLAQHAVGGSTVSALGSPGQAYAVQVSHPEPSIPRLEPSRGLEISIPLVEPSPHRLEPSGGPDPSGGQVHGSSAAGGIGAASVVGGMGAAASREHGMRRGEEPSVVDAARRRAMEEYYRSAGPLARNADELCTEGLPDRILQETQALGSYNHRLQASAVHPLHAVSGGLAGTDRPHPHHFGGGRRPGKVAMGMAKANALRGRGSYIFG